MSEHEFEVGDIVRWNSDKSGWGQSLVHGTLTRVDELTATAKPETGGRAVVFRRKSRLRDWPFHFIGEQQYTRVLWERRQPKCAVVVATMFKDSGLKVTAQIGRDVTKISQAIAELNALAQWMSEDPQS